MNKQDLIREKATNIERAILRDHVKPAEARRLLDQLRVAHAEIAREAIRGE